MNIITNFDNLCQVQESVGALRGCHAVPPPESTSLPCLYNNNSIENSLELTVEPLVSTLLNPLSPYYKRAAETLFKNVSRLIALAPSINHIGFVTLTFKDNVTDAKEANRRFNSFNTNFLSPSDDFGEWVRVMEPQKRGAWHYHLIVILKEDIRTGINFEEIAQGKYSSASPYLRKLWSKLRIACDLYGFGRSEMHPIRSTQEAMARYIGKYISKGLTARSDAQKGVRLVSYSKDWLKNSVKFQWHTPGSQLWRKKLAHFVASHGCTDERQVTEKLGSHWMYKHANHIMALPDDLTEEQTLDAYEKAFPFRSPSVEKIEKRTRQKWEEYDLKKQKLRQYDVPF